VLCATIVAKRAGIQDKATWDAAENGVKDIMDSDSAEAIGVKA